MVSTGDFQALSFYANMMNPDQRLNTRKRSFTVSEKIKYLRDFETALLNGEVNSMKDFADHYKISIHTFRQWNLQKLEEQEADKYGKKRKVREPENGWWPEVENQLRQWFHDLRGRRIPVAVQDLQEKALAIFRGWWDELEQERRQEITEAKSVRFDFKASVGWTHSFLKRSNLSLRKVTKNTATLPADAEQRMEVYRNDVADVIDGLSIQMRVVINMDQTFMLLDNRPMYTVNEKGAKAVDVRTSRSNGKLGCTVTLCISANGGKLAAHITFPRRGFVRQIQALDDEELPANVKYSSSQTGWVNEDILLNDWLPEVLEPFVREEDVENFLLIVDRFRAHRTERFGMQVTELGGILQFVPAGCTSLGQPLDVAVMKSFKSYARKAWKDWKKDNTDAQGACDKIRLSDVVHIVNNAWEAVNPQVIQNGFEAAFRPGHVDAGPQPVIDENAADDGIDFLDLLEDEVHG